MRERFGRDSYDDQGAPIISTVNYFEANGIPYVNAKWNGRQVVYGIGHKGKVLPLAGAMDIVFHEITHAITESTSGLIYRNESGALSEGFSDIMATYMEHKLYPNKADWKLAEDVWTPGKRGDAARYMDHPTRDGSSRDHYRERYTGYSDKGGVHRNSGIINLAFYLLANGGTHPRRPSHRVQSVGLERAIDIFYRAFTERYLAPSAKFVDAREATVLVAREYDEQTVLSVMQAWAAVGVGQLPQNKGQDWKTPLAYGKTAVAETEAPIPDNDREGIEDVLYVEDDVQTLSISVDIEHSYRGDLIVKAISPESISYTLHRRHGGSRDNLQTTFRVVLQSKDHSAGDWVLQVSDHANKDEGILKKWSISW